jgi:hypothetical protein
MKKPKTRRPLRVNGSGGITATNAAFEQSP